MSTAVLTVTESAARRISELVATEQAGFMLRVAVSGGGCSGYQYGFTLDDAVNPDDKLFGPDCAKVVIDETSLDLMGGAQIDFVDELVGANFTISNPLATANCGCGNSFAL